MNNTDVAREFAKLTADVEAAAIRKVFRRLMPVLMAGYFMAYLDRTNLSFAALTMNADLGLTMTMFGVATSVFFVTYVLFEIPSNVMLEKFGARIWIPRIMITWGLASMAMVFISGPYSLYLLRALLGAAEAGMLPGVLFFMSAWFPAASRAKANSLFLAAAPIGLVLGALLAGPILKMDGTLGLQGWQWLFLLEGFPTILLGIVAYLLLVDTPDQAKWLTSAEKRAIKAGLERSEPVQGHAKGTWKSVITRDVFVLAAIIYCNQTSTSILASWTPLIVRDAVGSGADVLLIALLSALPALTAIISMFVIGTLSDRHAERALYTAGGLIMAGAGWGICLLTPISALKILGLCLAAGGAFGSLVPFWAWVPEVIGREGRAVAVAAITSLATIASVATPIIVGFLRDLTGTFNSSIAFALAAIAVSVVILMLHRTPRHKV